MGGEVFTFIVGGKAGEGVKKAGEAASRMFSGMGRFIFQADEYESLIKGGHNFSTVSTAMREITGTYLKADLVVCLDRRSYDIHKDHLSGNGLLVHNSDAMPAGEWKGAGLPLTSIAKKLPNPELKMGLGAVAVLAAAVGLGRPELEALVRAEYARDVENNVALAGQIWDAAFPHVGRKFEMERGEIRKPKMFGNQAMALGAYAAGMDMFFAYPMTPSSSMLHYLAAHAGELGITVMHPESELAVINMAIGATYTGTRAMVGTAGGGFGLMVEALSLAGCAEAPVLIMSACRVGPSTGAATLHEQSDLRHVLGAGHGEFPRIVASPGDALEAFHLAAEMMELVWRFQTPGIILGDKHLCESTMTVEVDPAKAGWSEPLMFTGPESEYRRYRQTTDGVSPLMFPPTKAVNKWTSHVRDELGISTEDADLITETHDKLRRKGEAIEEHLRTIRTVNTFGHGGPVILTYGSTTMAVREAVRHAGIDCRIVQPVYLEPFPYWAIDCFRGGPPPIIVEQSSTGMFAKLLSEKLGIEPRPDQIILKYDGRPFDPEELARRLKEAM